MKKLSILNSDMDMIHGPLLKNIFIFSLPLLFSNLLQIAFNAADTIVVGKFSGQEALAAVGATGPIVNLLIAMFNGLATGANIIIAMQIGKREKERISTSVHTSYFLAIAGGVILTIVGLFLSKTFLTWMGTPENIIDQSTLYMQIYFAGSIPLLIYNFGSAILRSKGDTVGPTIYMTVSGVINILLNLVFVIGLKMGVSGVAIATVISETVSAILITRSLMRQKDSTRLYPDRLTPDRHLLLKIMQIGVPAGFQTMMWSISNIAVQSSINSFGSVAVAGNSAAANIESFVYIGMMSFSESCITFSSQCAGAGEKKRIRDVFNIIVALEFIVAFSTCSILWKFGEFFLSFYTNDPGVVEVGMIRMCYVVLWLFINAILDVPAASMRGMGHSTTPTVVMLIGVVGVRLLYIATIFRAVHTLPALYLCFPISWIVTTIPLMLIWLHYFKKFKGTT
ncbi:MAG: MATE family efflux transporter [Lachnospiraceae bacterium]|nr:MATE family efflux transporter [Lachnospiraceae bacterium]